MFTNLLLFLRLMYPYFYVRICSRSTYVFTLGSISISPPAHKMRCKGTTIFPYMQVQNACHRIFLPFWQTIFVHLLSHHPSAPSQDSSFAPINNLQTKSAAVFLPPLLFLPFQGNLIARFLSHFLSGHSIYLVSTENEDLTINNDLTSNK